MLLCASHSQSAQTLLTSMLHRYYGLSRLPALARTSQGKPYFPEYPDIHFNWSHSRRLTLCAVSQAPVGVDIEFIQPRQKNLPIYVFTETEFQNFQVLGADWPAFYTLWTRKEAWCKYTGEGLRQLWKKDPKNYENIYTASYGGSTWRASIYGEEPPPDTLFWWEGVCPP